jgi:holo-[acyl-carrier protein] synthase
MILGVGTDLLDLRRIERTLARFGERFLVRVYTANERERCHRRGNPVACLGQRYAAKEACAKALGTGFRDGVFWRDIEVGVLASGKPVIRLAGGARKRLAALTPAGRQARVDLSLTDEYPFAQAVVVISAEINQGVLLPL